MDVDRRRAAAKRALHAVYVHTATKLGNRSDFSRLDPVCKESESHPPPARAS